MEKGTEASVVSLRDGEELSVHVSQAGKQWETVCTRVGEKCLQDMMALPERDC